MTFSYYHTNNIQGLADKLRPTLRCWFCGFKKSFPNKILLASTSNHPLSFQLNGELIQQWKAIEQQNHSTRVMLACTGHTTKDIVKLVKLSKATVYWIFKEESKVNWKEHKTQSDSKHTLRYLAGLKRLIEVNPSTSMTALGKKYNVPLSTVSRLVNRDLVMTSYVQRHHYLQTAKAIRTKRCSKLRSFIKYQGAGKALVFVDKKKFPVDAEVNSRNFHVIAHDSSDIPSVFQTKNPASLVVFGAAVSDGSFMNPYFIAAGSKISTKEYLDILKASPLPWMEQNFELDNVVLIQDSVPNHTSKATQAYLGEKVPFFMRANIWLSNRPDLKHLDYFLWGVLKQRPMLQHLKRQKFEDMHSVRPAKSKG